MSEKSAAGDFFPIDMEPKRRIVPPVYFLLALIAMAALQKAFELGWRRSWWMRSDPALKSLRGRADFAALLRRIDDSNAALAKSVPAI